MYEIYTYMKDSWLFVIYTSPSPIPAVPLRSDSRDVTLIKLHVALTTEAAGQVTDWTLAVH